MDENNHEDSNCFTLTVISHGNDKGHLFDKNRKKAWDTELFLGELSDMETLVGNPKIITIQACRGCKYFYCRLTKLWKGNVFTSVCQELYPRGGGVHPQADTPLDRQPPGQTTPPDRHPAGQTPRADISRQTLPIRWPQHTCICLFVYFGICLWASWRNVFTLCCFVMACLINSSTFVLLTPQSLHKTKTCLIHFT